MRVRPHSSPGLFSTIEDEEDKFRRYSKIMNSEPMEPSSSSVLTYCRRAFSSIISKCIAKLSDGMNVFWTMISTLIIITIITLCLVRWFDDPIRYELTSMETRLIIPNTWIHSYIAISDPSSKMMMYYSKNPPPLTKIFPILLNETLEIDSKQLKYWGRYLHPGTQVTLAWEMDHTVSFYLFKSTNKFSAWLQKGKQEQEWSEQLQKCESKTYTVYDSADYYFVMENDDVTNPMKVIGYFYLLLNVTNYDISQADGYYNGNNRHDFTFGEKLHLVLLNPTKAQTHTIWIYFGNRLYMGCLLAFMIEIILLVVGWAIQSGRNQRESLRKKEKMRKAFQ